MVAGDGFAERNELLFLRNVGDVRGHPHARASLFLGELPGLGHRVFGDVTRGDIAPGRGKLPHQLPADARAPAGDHRQLVLQVTHRSVLPAVSGHSPV